MFGLFSFVYSFCISHLLFMWQFFKYMFATIIGMAAFFAILIFSLIGIGAAFSSDQEVKVKDKSVLKITLDQPLAERSEDNPFEDLDMPIAFGEPAKAGLLEHKKAIVNAKNDGRIKGILLDLAVISGGSAQVSELRSAIEDFKTSGKFVYAYGDAYSEKAYHLASVADKIYLNPQGMLEFNGLVADITFIKGLLEKIGVKPMVFKVGTFKSAIEPFIRDDMSEPNRLQTTAFINSIYDGILRDISASRNIPYNQLEMISDSMMVRNAQDALKYKLVDKLAYYDELEDDIRMMIEDGTTEMKATEASLIQIEDEQADGVDESTEDDDDDKKKDKKINYISPGKYSKVKSDSKSSKNKIAVIFATGQIGGGKSGADNIGPDLAKTIRDARKDKRVKAIVLRVNSPGGSALVSDIIWREVKLASQEKPVVASMSSVAASGGYYISMACDQIVADPNTVTGSIGVFGLLFNAEELLQDKMGITSDRVKTGVYADLGNPNRTMTDAEKQIIQQSVEEIYIDFTNKAAEGRNMNVDTLRKYAEGRVWTGEQAVEIGLIDKLGSLETAIETAAELAELEDDYRLRYLPAQKDFFKKLTESFETSMQQKAAKAYLGDYYPMAQRLQNIKDMKGIQARLPYELDIR